MPGVQHRARAEELVVSSSGSAGRKSKHFVNFEKLQLWSQGRVELTRSPYAISLASGKAPAASRRERRARRSAQACSPLRCHRQPEQPTNRLVNDPGRLGVRPSNGNADDAGGGRPGRRGSRSPGRGGPPRTAGTAGRVDSRRGRRQNHPAGRDDVLRRPRRGRTDRRPGRRRHPRPADRRRCHRRGRRGPGSGDLRVGVLRAGPPQVHGRRRRRRVGQNPRVDPRGRGSPRRFRT